MGYSSLAASTSLMTAPFRNRRMWLFTGNAAISFWPPVKLTSSPIKFASCPDDFRSSALNLEDGGWSGSARWVVALVNADRDVVWNSTNENPVASHIQSCLA